MVWKQKLTWDDDICMMIVDRGACGRVWPADVERFLEEMAKNRTTCASQSWVQMPVRHFRLQMWWGFGKVMTQVAVRWPQKGM